MKLQVIALSALLLSPAAMVAPAQAQLSSGEAAKRVYNWCLQLETGSPSECACVAGFFAGATDDDAYRMLATMIGYLKSDGQISDQDAMLAALEAEKQSQRISDERYAEILDHLVTFDSLGAKADAICVPIEALANGSDE
jgi:hypothetical protein